MVRSGIHFGVGVARALLLAPGAGLSAQVTAELDALWAEVSRTVQSGDFDGYSATYHPDAVVIFGDSTQPISAARHSQATFSCSSGDEKSR